MIRVNVKFDIDRARRDFANLGKEVNKAAVRSLERVGVTARKEADKEIRKRLKLKSSTVKESLRIVKGRPNLYVEIVASGKPIALREYNANRTQKGVTFKVAASMPRRLYKRQGRVGFIVPKFGSHVFVRTGPNPPGAPEAKITKVYGPSIPQYFVTRFVRERMLRIAKERFPIEFARELNFRASRAAA
jgi:hypothetical protein